MNTAYLDYRGLFTRGKGGTNVPCLENRGHRGSEKGELIPTGGMDAPSQQYRRGHAKVEGGYECKSIDDRRVMERESGCMTCYIPRVHEGIWQGGRVV